jgi:hypothetical protein
MAEGDGLWLEGEKVGYRHMQIGQLMCATVLALGISSSRASGQTTIDNVIASPAMISAGKSTGVTVQAAITGRTPLGGSVTLLRVDSQGGNGSVIQTMRDDGQNGDAISGDGIYTARLSFSPATSDPIYLTVSAAVTGVLKRVRSNVIQIGVSSNQTQEQIIDSIATGLGDSSTAESAITEMLKYANLGVYSSGGVAISKGAERGLGDFYLFDFEIPMLAGLAARDQSYNLDDLRGDFDICSIYIPALKDSSSFLKLLNEAARQALADPDNPTSFAMLLVRQLGLRSASPYDLSAENDPARVSLSGLQKWLLLADVTLPMIWADPATPVVAFDDPDSAATPASAQEQSPVAKEPPPTIRALAEIAPAAPSFGSLYKFFSDLKEGADMDKKFVEQMHAELLIRAIRIAPVQPEYAFQYRDSGSPATSANIQVKVTADPETVKRYKAQIPPYESWLGRIKFPNTDGDAAQDEVKLQWQNADLQPHGAVTCEASCKNTSSNGIATLIFSPKEDASPVGTSTETIRGFVTVTVDFGLSAYKSDGLAHDLFKVRTRIPVIITRHVQNWTGYLQAGYSAQLDRTLTTTYANGFSKNTNFTQLIENYKFTASGTSSTVTQMGTSITVIPGTITMPYKLLSTADLYSEATFGCDSLHVPVTSHLWENNSETAESTVVVSALMTITKRDGFDQQQIGLEILNNGSFGITTNYETDAYFEDPCDGGDSESKPITYSGITSPVFPKINVVGELPDGSSSDDQWKLLLGDPANIPPDFTITGEHTYTWHLEQVPTKQ